VQTANRLIRTEFYLEYHTKKQTSTMVEIDMEDVDSHPNRDSNDVDMNDDNANGNGAEEPPPRLLITKMVS